MAERKVRMESLAIPVVSGGALKLALTNGSMWGVVAILWGDKPNVESAAFVLAIVTAGTYSILLIASAGRSIFAAMPSDTIQYITTAQPAERIGGQMQQVDEDTLLLQQAFDLPAGLYVGGQAALPRWADAIIRGHERFTVTSAIHLFRDTPDVREWAGGWIRTFCHADWAEPRAGWTADGQPNINNGVNVLDAGMDALHVARNRGRAGVRDELLKLTRERLGPRARRDIASPSPAENGGT